jgi:hypothetical protein
VGFQTNKVGGEFFRFVIEGAQLTVNLRQTAAQLF